MSETPDERFDRLAESMESRVGAGYGRGGLTALLEELRRGDDGDKALADMLENGAEQYVAHGGHEDVPAGWYRPRACG